MLIKDGKLYKINLKLRELAIKESKHEITEEEYEKERKILQAKAYELTQVYIAQTKPKKEEEGKTKATSLSRFF